MPTYVYRNGNEIKEWSAPMGKAPQRLFCAGRLFDRDLRAEHMGQKSGDPWTEHESLALMVHPDDIRWYQEDAFRRGCGAVDFNPETGMPRFHSNGQRKKYMKAYGFVDRASWY